MNGKEPLAWNSFYQQGPLLVLLIFSKCLLVWESVIFWLAWFFGLKKSGNEVAYKWAWVRGSELGHSQLNIAWEVLGTGFLIQLLTAELLGDT